MADRDDIVITPRLDDVAGATTATRAREERHAERFSGKRGMLRKVAKLKAARMARKKMMRRASSAKARPATSRFISPVGIAVAAVVTVGAIAARAATGKSFENMGANISRSLLGDKGIDARASMQTRQQMEGNSDLMRAIGQTGHVSNQIASVFKDLQEMRKKELQGEAMFMEDPRFQSSGKLGVMVDRAGDLLREEFKNMDFDDILSKVRSRLWMRGIQSMRKIFGK